MSIAALFQGGHELHDENARPFGLEPSGRDVVLLTHAHLDPCGRLPLFCRQGFRGETISTLATRDPARLVLLDPAHLHEEEARCHHRHGHRGGRHEALYDTVDALDAIDRFGRVASCGKSLKLFPGMTATFCDAGQILGSASIRLELREDGQQRRILFSGDLGPSDRPLLNDPAPPDDADIVVLDTTYGDRDHLGLEISIAEFGSALRHTARRGNVELTPASVRVECQCMGGLRSVVMKVSGAGARYPRALCGLSMF